MPHDGVSAVWTWERVVDISCFMSYVSQFHFILLINFTLNNIQSRAYKSNIIIIIIIIHAFVPRRIFPRFWQSAMIFVGFTWYSNFAPSRLIASHQVRKFRRVPALVASSANHTCETDWMILPDWSGLVWFPGHRMPWPECPPELFPQQTGFHHQSR